MTNILLIDEERSVRQAIKFELENEGFVVIDVNNYKDALSAYNAFKCDVVISDISDDKGHSMYFLNYFKNIPLIAMTAFPESRVGRRAKDLLEDRFFEKPFPIKNLILKVNEMVNNTFAYAQAV